MCALSVFVALLLVGTSHCLMVEWEAQDYPNPMFDMEKCGRHIGRRSYVCDPNGIISVKDGKEQRNCLYLGGSSTPHHGQRLCIIR